MFWDRSRRSLAVSPKSFSNRICLFALWFASEFALRFVFIVGKIGNQGVFIDVVGVLISIVQDQEEIGKNHSRKYSSTLDLTVTFVLIAGDFGGCQMNEKKVDEIRLITGIIPSTVVLQLVRVQLTMQFICKYPLDTR